MLRAVTTILAALFLAPAAFAASHDRSAGDFLKATYVQELNGQYGRAWDTLYPAQQRFVNRDRFIDCMQQANVDATLKGFKVLDVYHERIGIPGTSLHVMSTAVTYRLTVAGPDGKQESGNSTSHAILVDGRWRWPMESQKAVAFKAGRCPT